MVAYVIKLFCGVQTLLVLDVKCLIVSLPNVRPAQKTQTSAADKHTHTSEPSQSRPNQDARILFQLTSV